MSSVNEMRIDKIDIKPATESINPEFIFNLNCILENNREIPLEISGYVLSDDNKKLANMHQIVHLKDQQIQLSALEDRYNNNNHTYFELTASLNRRILDHIETLRTTNSKSDVILNIEIFVKLLKNNIIHSNMILGGRNKDGFQQVLYKHDQDSSTRPINMWILSGNNGPDFIRTVNMKFTHKVIISSSDWIHDYCPVFQIGKFAVFEYLLPEYTEGTGSIEERLNASVNSIQKMENNIIKGEWNKVIEDSRVVAELLRNQDDFKDLLLRDGYSEQAFENLNQSIKELFKFSSKFIHKEDMGKKEIMPEIKASKEDAYLIYSLSMSLVNLISKKFQRLQS